ASTCPDGCARSGRAGTPLAEPPGHCSRRPCGPRQPRAPTPIRDRFGARPHGAIGHADIPPVLWWLPDRRWWPDSGVVGLDVRPRLSPHGTTTVGRLGQQVVALVPGLALVAVCVALAFAVNGAAPSVSPLVVAVVAGAVLANLGLVRPAATAGTQFAAK